MELLVIFFIVWVVRAIFSGGNNSYNYTPNTSSYANTQPSLATLSIRKLPGTDEGVWYSVKLKGYFPFTYDSNYNFVCSLVDITDGLENAHPILSFFPEIQEQNSPAFQFIRPDVFIPAYGGWEDYTEIMRIPVDMISPPRKGKRKLGFVLRVYSTYSDLSDINYGFGGENAVYELTKDFFYSFEQAGYEERVENKDKIVKYSIELAMSMANVDGNFDLTEKKIIEEWIQEKSKVFNEDKKDWEQDKELLDLYLSSYDEALEETKDGNLPISQILNNFNEIADDHSKHDVVDLCYKVLAADGDMGSAERNLIKVISDELNLHQDLLEGIKDEHMLSLSISDKDHSEEDIYSILGLDSSMSRGEKIDKLRNDFSKWNSRLNVVSSQEEKANAQEMIDLISKELKKLR